jgi:hypothetical protein
MPTIEPALFMRVILLTFEDGKFTEEQRKCFQQLKDIEAPGLSYISAGMLRHRDLVEKSFKERYQMILKQTIVDVANVEVDDRMIVNISMLLTFFNLFKDQLQFPFTYADAKGFLIENMLQQHNILAGNSDVAKFWDVIQTLFAMELVQENKDFVLEDGYIYIRLMQVYPLYMKEMRQRGDPNVLAKPTLEHYLKLDKTMFIDYVRKRFNDGSNNWCYKLKYAKLHDLFKVDLIKLVKTGVMSDIQHDFAVMQKHRDMKVDYDGEMKGVEDEIPFPIIKN